ncbi:hypothetical protein SAMN05192573_101586 [Mucilaginibacter gossypii]|uniref:Uncharacterized protein n=1 Tax=Mucilaginibacter gossypii TaxID=551996 RepID=A0A1G7PJR3_9SPHI|nr:hypothetical protein SAMN05192573_101586 [Mucilaginibacter gossypii]
MMTVSYLDDDKHSENLILFLLLLMFLQFVTQKKIFDFPG